MRQIGPLGGGFDGLRGGFEGLDSGRGQRGRRRRHAVTPYTPEAGGGWISASYDYVHMQNHLDADGKAADIGSMNSQRLGVSAEYGVTDRLAIYGGVPYVQSQYTVPTRTYS